MPSASPGTTGVGILAIAPGIATSCAVVAGGAVKCWGDNTEGRLGDGSAAAPESVPETSSAIPVNVTGLGSGVTAIATGATGSCAITAAGGVECWGSNESGQLGNGTTMDKTTLANIYSAVPVNVTGLGSGITAIAEGNGFACALTTAGGVKCWGSNGVYGMLGNGSATSGPTTSSSTPVDVSGLSSGVTAISAGLDYACALISGGGIKCWGHGGDIFNIGNFANSTVPVAVADPGLSSGVNAISAGGTYLCVLTTAGGVKCIGSDRFGQIGSGQVAPKPGTSADVTGLTTGVAAVSAGGQLACALLAAGGVKCWGDGYGTAPVDVAGLPDGVTHLAAGWTSACVIAPSSGAECWGGTTSTGVSAPAPVPGL